MSARSWVLVLDKPKADPCRLVAGLPLALRLALDAQAAGALAVVVVDRSERLLQALRDPRLHIPVSPDAPSGARRIHTPADHVIHRATWRELAAHAEPGDRYVLRDARPPAVPWTFTPLLVGDAASARVAERALFRSLRKAADGWTSRWLNRYISLWLSRHLVRTSITPNQLSVGILVLGLVGAWCAAVGTHSGLVLGAVLFQCQSVLDGCDGEVSRATHRTSLRGEWLDTLGDDLTNYAFFVGASLGMYRLTGNPLYLVVGAVISLAGLSASAIEYRYLLRIGSGDLQRYPLTVDDAGGGREPGVFAAIRPLFKRDTFVLLTLIAALLGQLGPLLVIFALGAIGILIGVLSAELRMARERTEAAAAGDGS